MIKRKKVISKEKVIIHKTKWYRAAEGGIFLNKIKPAYLKAVNTVYNGTQQSFHAPRNNGKAKPFEVDLTLSFQESLKLTKEDVKDGF